MENIKRFTWTVVPVNTPLYIKKCSRCKDSNHYYCSDKFRVNSQKRSLDVWLIYKCVKCDSTCNITILSRTKPELINKELYQKFIMNDKDTAWRYAFDPVMAGRNSMELDYNSLECDIVCDCNGFEDILNRNEDIIEFEIKFDIAFYPKLTSLLKKFFELSSSQLDRMIDLGIIVIRTTTAIKKIKAKSGIVLAVNREMLRQYLGR